MNIPSLATLPPPPSGKTGWPWTAESPELPSGAHWPRISIVTPSFNQGRFLEETIRSVLLQRYPGLEYFIMDGGSRDESLEIIKKYEPWLAGWTSGKDGGQPDAINQGWKRASGDILAWLNSDDWYLPGALAEAGTVFRDHPETDWVAGEVLNCRTADAVLKHHRPHFPTLPELLGRKNYGLHQPGMFWRRRLVERTGQLDTALQYSFTHDFWARMLVRRPAASVISRPLVCFRVHDHSKTTAGKHLFLREDRRVLDRYACHLRKEERRQAERWLQEYEADQLYDIIGHLLARGRRDEARRFLAGRWRLLTKVRPRKIIPGLCWRVWISGKTPEEFSGPA